MPVRLQLTDELPQARPWSVDGSDQRSQPCQPSSVRYLAVLLVLASVALGGCSTLKDWAKNDFKVGPEYGRPAAPVSEEWIDAYDERVTSELPIEPMWWEVFEDPKLNQLVQTVDDQNLSLRAAGMRVLTARAQRNIAIGGLFPQQQTDFGQYRRDLRSIATSGFGQLIARGFPVGGREVTTWSTGTNMVWELDIWGKFRRGIEASDARLEASVEDYDAVLVSLIAETATTYVEYRTAQQRLAYAKENVAAQKGSLEIVEDKQELGVATGLDVAQTTATLKNTEQLVPQYEFQIRNANNRLCTLLGIPIQDLSEELGEGSIPTAPSEVAVGIPADLLRRRPDVRAAERRVAAQCATIGVTVADLFPHFSISGALQFESERFKHLLTSNATAGHIAPGFQWDILNYGRLIAAVRAEESRFQELAYEYQQAVLTANQEAETAINAFLKAQKRLVATSEAVEASRTAWSIGKDQEAEGLIDYNRVFNLQVLKVQDEDRYATTRGDVALALITIYRSLGGGWEIREGYSPAVGEEAASEAAAGPASEGANAEDAEIPVPESIEIEDAGGDEAGSEQ